MICVSLKKVLFPDILFVEVQQRDDICRRSDKLYNSCKESDDFICKGSSKDYSVQIIMILINGRFLIRLTNLSRAKRSDFENVQ